MLQQGGIVGSALLAHVLEGVVRHITVEVHIRLHPPIVIHLRNAVQAYASLSYIPAN